MRGVGGPSVCGRPRGLMVPKSGSCGRARVMPSAIPVSRVPDFLSYQLTVVLQALVGLLQLWGKCRLRGHWAVESSQALHWK